jgi:hypothetical protein
MIHRHERDRINALLIKQQENINQLHYFNDEDQD